MKKKFTLFLVTLAMVLVPAFAAQAAIVTYNNFTNWLAAVGTGNSVTENFNDTTLITGLSITEVGGAGSIHDGVYENIVDKDVPRYQIYNFTSMYAFGAWMDLQPGGQGTSIDMYVNDTNTFAMNIPNDATGQFFGFISTTPFTGVRFQDGGGAGIQETYYNIDLSLAPVPEPLTMLLLGLGLVGLAGVRRFK